MIVRVRGAMEDQAFERLLYFVLLRLIQRSDLVDFPYFQTNTVTTASIQKSTQNLLIFTIKTISQLSSTIYAEHDAHLSSLKLNH